MSGQVKIKKNTVLLLLVLLLAVLIFPGTVFPAPSQTPAETELVSLLNMEIKPGRDLPAVINPYVSVYGDKVVFTDSVDGNSDVYLYDFVTGETARLTANPVNQTAPRIYGDYIAWLDYRQGVTDLYLYDLATGKKRRVDRLFNNVTETLAGWFKFDLDEKRLVYSKKQGENRDLYLFDIASGKRERLTNGGINLLPRIYKDNVVYVRRQGGQNRIFLAEIAGRKVKQISPSEGNFDLPAMHGENVIFLRDDNTAVPEKKGQLLLYNIDRGTLETIPDIEGVKTPVMYEDRVVWADRSTGNFREYNLKTKKVKSVTAHVSRKTCPDLQGKRLVWADNYSGRWGIYSRFFDDVSPALTVMEPEDNLRTNNNLAAVTGYAETGSSVRVNGTTVPMDNAGNFNQVLELSTGKNTVTVTAADASGNTATVERTVYYMDDKIFGLDVGPNPVIIGYGAFIQYTLAQKGSVTIKVLNDGGDLVRTIAGGLLQNAGPAFQSWDGKDNRGTLVEDGKYRFVVEARDETGRFLGKAEKEVTAARLPGISNVSHPAAPFNPIAGSQAVIDYTLSSDALVTVNITGRYNPVVTLAQSEFLQAGSHRIKWNGRDSAGNQVGDGTYEYQIEAVSRAVYEFSAYYRGSVVVEGQNPQVTDLAVYPDPFNLNGGSASILFTLSENARVTLKILNSKGTPVRTLLKDADSNAGFNSAAWDGRDDNGKTVPAGTYKVEVSAVDGYGKPSLPAAITFKAGSGSLITKAGMIQASSAALPSVYLSLSSAVEPEIINPLKGERAAINYNVNKTARVTVRILKIGAEVNAFTFNETGAVSRTVYWDGKDAGGGFAGDGIYTYFIEAVNGDEMNLNTGNIVVESAAPAISELTLTPEDYYRLGHPAPLLITFQLSEQANVSVDVYQGGSPVRKLVTDQLQYAGFGMVTWDGKDDSGQYGSEGSYNIVIRAADAAGNITEAKRSIAAGYFNVVSASPKRDSTGVPVNGKIIFSFNDMVQEGRNFKGITVKAGGGEVMFNAALLGSELVLEPVFPFFYDTSYTVTIPPGAVKDYLGNELKNGYTLRFTTEENPLKLTAGKPPVSGSTQIDLAGAVSVGVSEDKGLTVASVTVDEKSAMAVIRENPGYSAVLIPVNGDAEKIICRLPGSLVTALAGQKAAIEIRTKAASVMLPAVELKPADLARQIGVNTPEVMFNIVIARAAPEKTIGIDNFIRKEGLRQLTVALEFTIEAAAGNKKTLVNSFSRYLNYVIYLPEVVDAGTANGMMLNTGSTLLPAPAKFTILNGGAAVVIKSRNTGIFTVVAGRKAFKDVTSHWARDDINMLAAKQILKGVDKERFAPDKKVTRAEFAALIVRALGIPPGSETERFRDIQADDWFKGAAAAAFDAGIVSGYADGTFRPHKYITREEAAVMAVKALAAAGLDISLSDAEVTRNLGKYKDGSGISPWARQGAAKAIKYGLIAGNSNGRFHPTGYVTRGELAVIVKNILTKADFI